MKTILLIDDNLLLRMTFSKALQTSGYTVIEADSGTTGLAMARQHLPDLILSDVNMPGGDGSTLLRDIRNDPELRSKQVVLMTGRPDLMTPRKGMDAGADDFLQKPVSFDVLLSCMETRFRRASINWRVEDQMLAQLRSSIPAQLPHEFFTPLAGIIGLVEILQSDDQELAKDEVREIYKDLQHSALRLHRTLRNYLLILELQNPSFETLMGSLAPSQVEENIIAGINDALQLNRRDEDLNIQIKSCPISIKPGDLCRIVEELVDNAFKFSRQGTPVKVEMNPKGILTVSDEGRGLTEEEINRIGAFQQFDRKKHEQQGLGLGLVLVQKLVTLSQAEFSITSQPGKGTHVRIAFPLMSEE